MESLQEANLAKLNWPFDQLVAKGRSGSSREVVSAKVVLDWDSEAELAALVRLEAVLALQTSEACCYKQNSGFELEVLIKRICYVLAQRHGAR